MPSFLYELTVLFLLPHSKQHGVFSQSNLASALVLRGGGIVGGSPAEEPVAVARQGAFSDGCCSAVGDVLGGGKHSLAIVCVK